MFLTLVDFVGCFAFALSGGTRAVERRLDPFGIVFLAFVAATFGGIIRDVVIGAVPPVAFATWHYFAISCLAGFCCIFAHHLIARLAAPVAVFDALGLGLYVVVGTRKAMDAASAAATRASRARGFSAGETASSRSTITVSAAAAAFA